MIDTSKLNEFEKSIIVWLGYWREKMPPGSVESLQRLFEGHVKGITEIEELEAAQPLRAVGRRGSLARP